MEPLFEAPTVPWSFGLAHDVYIKQHGANQAPIRTPPQALYGLKYGFVVFLWSLKYGPQVLERGVHKDSRSGVHGKRPCFGFHKHK